VGHDRKRWCDKDNLLPATLSSREFHGFASEGTSIPLGGGVALGSNARYDARLLPDRDRYSKTGSTIWRASLFERVGVTRFATTLSEFAHDVAAVCLRRLHAEIQHRSNFFCTLALSKKLHDFPLTCCQPRQADLLGEARPLPRKNQFRSPAGLGSFLLLLAMAGGTLEASRTFLKNAWKKLTSAENERV